VLSGFLITGILLDAKGAPHYFRNFYARRTLRIFPLYYLSLALFFLVLPLFPALDTEGFRAVARNQAWLWTYTMNLYTSFNAAVGGKNPFAGDWVQTLHFWSLSVEEQFYLVWPAIVLMTTRRQLRAVTIVCFAGAWALRLYFVSRGNSGGPYFTAPYFFTLCRLDDLAAGAFVAVAARERGGLERLAACAPWAAVLALWALLGTAVQLRHFFPLEAAVQTRAYSAFTLLYASLLVFALTARDGAYRRWLRNPVLRSYGKYSYAIYIFHWGLSGLIFFRIIPLEALTERLGSQDAALAVRAIAVAVLSWGMGFASWHLCEKHFLRLKRYFYADK
jgi:peptidoglycan/LPS O-acetylase OafA/YrhL